MVSLSIDQINHLQEENTQLKKILIKINKILLQMKKADEGQLTECFYQDKQCQKCSKEKCLTYWFTQIEKKVSEVLNEMEHN